MPLEDSLWPRLNVARDLDVLPTWIAGSEIPKILHQTYHSSDLPAPIREAIDRTRAANPGWEYRFYDDEAIVAFIRAEYGSEVLATYRRITYRYGAARADLFRYLLMYRVGGVYLDIKSVPTKPLDEVVGAGDRYLLSHWHGERFTGVGVHPELEGIGTTEYQQWHIVAAPGHPFLKAAAENVLRNLRIYNPGFHGVGRIGVLRVTGPIAYTRAIHPLLGNQPHRFVESERELGFDYSLLMTGHDMSAHASLLRWHYSTLKEPIVKVGPVRNAYGFTVRKLRKKLRFARPID